MAKIDLTPVLEARANLELEVQRIEAELTVERERVVLRSPAKIADLESELSLFQAILGIAEATHHLARRVNTLIRDQDDEW